MIYNNTFKPERIMLLLCTLLCCACSHGISGDEDDMEDYITLKIALTQNEDNNVDSYSRSVELFSTEVEEEGISSLKLFIFNAANALETYKHISITGGASSDPAWDAGAKMLRIPVIAGEKHIYCVANWEDDGEGMPVIDDATVSTAASLNAVARSHAELVRPPLVMTGNVDVNVTGNETVPFSLVLTRQTARLKLSFRIDMPLSELGADVRIMGIRLLSLPTHSYLFKASTPGTPTSSGLWRLDDFYGEVSSPLTTAPLEYTTVYIPEYYPAMQDEASVLQIKALYHNQVNYYHLVIDPSKSEEPVHEYEPYTIVRNHSYNYDVTIAGPGSASVTRHAGGEPASEYLRYKLAIE